MLATLLGGIWPRSPFMTKLARKTPSNLREFMDKADDFINAKETRDEVRSQKLKQYEGQEDWVKPSRGAAGKAPHSGARGSASSTII